MTPKQKAAHLIITFMSVVPKKDIAKECAIKFVENVLNSDPQGTHFKYDYHEYKLGCDEDYWNQVNEEINKL